MPQWTLAVVWKNIFNSAAVMGTSDGALAYFFGVHMPEWWCCGLFPAALVLGIPYAPFAYILIGGIFRNMDANLEEAATILNTPKWKTFTHVTLPVVKPAFSLSSHCIGVRALSRDFSCRTFNIYASSLPSSFKVL